MKRKLVKRATALLSTAAMLLTCADLSAIDFSVYAESAPDLTAYDVNNDGTIEDSEMAYRLDSAEDLYWFAGLVNGTLKNVEHNSAACAYLDTDITVNSNVLVNGKLNSEKADSFTEWTPIGNGNSLFLGALFDGNGHTISGLYFNDNSKANIGLFGYIFNPDKTTIRNVNIADSYFCGKNYVGSICGQAYATTEFINCSNSGTVLADSSGGGICGENGIFKSCTNTGMINGWMEIGGIVGQNISIIKSCTNAGTVTATSDFISGICGLSCNGKVTNCTNSGDVTGADSVGGICGEQRDSEITYCNNKGAVTGGKDTGGICGENWRNSTIINSMNTGAVTGTSETGGICGNNTRGTVDSCSNAGTVTSSNEDSSDIGGVCGYNNGLLCNCDNKAAVTGKKNVGGVCGQHHNENDDYGPFTKGITRCHNSGNIYGADSVGGVSGYNAEGTILESYNTGIITAENNAGGVCGINNTNSQIKECYNTADVQCSGNDIGGVCGTNYNAIIDSCSTGDVTGAENVGGVCGNNDTKSKISNCYSTGGVSGSEYVGGVCGINSSKNQTENCYFLSSKAFGGINGKDIKGEAEAKSVEAFASGEVCWLLDGGENKPAVPSFYQNLGEDDAPSLGYPRHDVKYDAEKSEYYNKHEFLVPDFCITCLKLNDDCKATFISAGLTLTDGVIMEYYVVVNDDFDTANSKVEFSLANGEKTEIPFSKAKKEDKNIYLFSLPLAPNLMKEEITGQIIGSDGTAVSEIHYSVSEYIDEVYEIYDYDPKTCDLARAMLKYGEYARAYSDNSDDTSHYTQNYRVGDEYRYTVNENSKGLKIKSASLILGSGVSIHLQYEVTDGKNYTFECNSSKNLRVEKNGNIYDVYLDGILPQNFNTMYKFTSSDGDTFTYSVFTYIKNKIDSGDNSLANLLNAMYEYNQAADAYLS